MIGLGVIGSIGQQAIDGQTGHRLPDRRNQVRGIVTRSQPDTHGRDQMAGVVHHQRQLRPSAVVLDASAAVQEMAADLMTFQPRGVDTGFGMCIDQAATTGGGEYSIEQPLKSFFFNRRASAF